MNVYLIFLLNNMRNLFVLKNIMKVHKNVHFIFLAFIEYKRIEFIEYKRVESFRAKSRVSFVVILTKLLVVVFFF